METTLNKSALQLGLPSSGFIVNACDLPNKGNQVTLISSINYGIFSIITPAAYPAGTVLTGVHLYVTRNKTSIQQNASLISSYSDILFFDSLKPQDIYSSKFLDFSRNPIRLESGDNGTVIMEVVSDGTSSFLTQSAAHLTVIGEQVSQERSKSLGGWILK